MIERFYWLIENGIAGSSRPGGLNGGRARHPTWRGGDDPAGTLEALESDLVWLREREIEAVLSLTETPLAQEALVRQELAYLHLPVPDLKAPLPRQLERALDFVDWQRASGRAVVVHCLMGQGRTATVLAAYLIRGGRSADESIAELRALCPGAIGSPEQERALHAFAARRDWML